MKIKITLLSISFLTVLALVFFLNPLPSLKNVQQIDYAPSIYPDYTAIQIPNNLAPLNFLVKEKAEQYLIKISASNGKEINLYQKNPEIEIPSKRWKQLLSENLNDTLSIEIFAKNEDQWLHFKTIINFISEDKISPFLYYRDIVPTNSFWNQMSMHQRDMESFTETEIINNHRTDHNCVNCHTFNQNKPDQMLFHIRGKHSGTIFYNKGELKKVNLKTPETISAGAYCSWHPSGKIVAFAVNKIKQNYYLTGHENKMKEVFDLASDIVFYKLDSNTLFSFPQISSDNRENLPYWSPNGKYLYYTQAKAYKTDMPNEENLYSLMRIRYNIETNSLGEPEVVISEDETKKSIAFPCISPDGKFMVFCMVDFGYFPVNNKTSNLYLMDLQSNSYHKLNINSNESESYISWSGNSRWFVFSSRRLDGMTSKPFFCHIDSMGVLSKPFILPQKNPLFYTIDHRNFARPELINEQFNLTFDDLKEVIFDEATEVKFEQK